MKHIEIRNMNKKWREYRLDETVSEENESLWTWVYKGVLGGFKKAEKKGGGSVSLDEIARGVAFLVKTEFGHHAKNDFIKSLKRYIR